MKSWLKGGLWGLLVHVVLQIYGYFSSSPEGRLLAFELVLVFTLIPLFVLGALIGWIIGRIKHKK